MGTYCEFHLNEAVDFAIENSKDKTAIVTTCVGNHVCTMFDCTYMSAYVVSYVPGD